MFRVRRYSRVETIRCGMRDPLTPTGRFVSVRNCFSPKFGKPKKIDVDTVRAGDVCGNCGHVRGSAWNNGISRSIKRPNANRHGHSLRRGLPLLLLIWRIWLTAILFIKHRPGWCLFHISQTLWFFFFARRLKTLVMWNWGVKRGKEKRLDTAKKTSLRLITILFGRCFGNISHKSVRPHELTLTRMGHKPDEHDALTCSACETLLESRPNFTAGLRKSRPIRRVQSNQERRLTINFRLKANKQPTSPTWPYFSFIAKVHWISDAIFNKKIKSVACDSSFSWKCSSPRTSWESFHSFFVVSGCLFVICLEVSEQHQKVLHWKKMLEFEKETKYWNWIWLEEKNSTAEKEAGERPDKKQIEAWRRRSRTEKYVDNYLEIWFVAC